MDKFDVEEFERMCSKLEAPEDEEERKRIELREKDRNAAMERLLAPVDGELDPESGRDSFASSTAVLLLGLGLTVSEVEVFKRHGLGINQLLTLTDSDLVYLGITCPKKRQVYMDYLTMNQKYKTPSEKQQKPKIIDCRPDCPKALGSTTKHLQALSRALPYLRYRMLSINGDCFFSNGISAAYTLDVILELCVQQAKETQEQLLALARELDKDEEKGKPCKKFGRKKWLLFIMLTGSCASLVAWGLRSVGSGFWLNRWPASFCK